MNGLSERLREFLNKVQDWLLVALAAAAPFPSVEIWKLALSPSQAASAWRLGPGDVVLALLAVVVMMRLWLSRGERWRNFLPPIGAFALVVVALLSTAFAGEDRSWMASLKELAQLVEVFIVCWGISRAAATDVKTCQRVVFALSCAMAVHVFFAAIQCIGGAHPFHVRGLFVHRNSFGCLLAAGTPPLVAMGLARGQKLWLRIWLLAVPTIGMLLMTSGWLLVAQVSGALAAIGFLRLRMLPVAFVFVAAIVAIQLAAMPGISKARARAMSFFPSDESGRTAPSMRLRRWVAVWECFKDNPILGVGLGQFQARIGSYYRPPYDKPIGSREDVAGYDIRFDEPGSQGWFEVTLCETGTAGILALFWLLVSTAVRAARGRCDPTGAGGLGTCIAVLVGGAFAAFLVRGVALSMAMLLALGDGTSSSGESSP